MNTHDLNHLAISDMIFHSPDNTEREKIHNFFLKESRQKLARQRFFSLIIAVIIIITEIIGRFNMGTQHTITGMTIIVLGALMLYNIVITITTGMKRQMSDIVEKYQCVSGIVVEKYDSEHLSQTNRENVPSYILFYNEQGYCTTALSVKNKKHFQSIQVGDNILVIKGHAMGNAHYTFTT